LASALANGEWDRAEQLLHSAYPWELEALDSVATALVDAKEWDRAERLAFRFSSVTGKKGLALIALAKAMADAREWDRAAQLALSISDPVEQSDVLAAVLGPLGRVLNPIASQHGSYLRERDLNLLRIRGQLLAVLLTNDDWYAGLPLVACFNPGVAVKAHDALSWLTTFSVQPLQGSP
jgi:hypothetical protein